MKLPVNRASFLRLGITVGICIFILVVLLVIMPLVGWHVADVSGQSMEPTYRSGDMVLVKRCKTLKEGDVAVYKTAGGAHIIHRVVIAMDDGLYWFQGDNNPQPDVELVTQDQIIGRVILHVHGYPISSAFEILFLLFLAVYTTVAAALALKHHYDSKTLTTSALPVCPNCGGRNITSCPGGTSEGYVVGIDWICEDCCTEFGDHEAHLSDI